MFSLSNSLFHKDFFDANTVFYAKNQVNTSHVLAALLQGLFAVCRIALSMVAGGTQWYLMAFTSLAIWPSAGLFLIQE